MVSDQNEKAYVFLFCLSSSSRKGAAGRSTCIAESSSVRHRDVLQFGAFYTAHIEKRASMNGLELSLQVEIKRIAPHFRNHFEAVGCPRSIKEAIPENLPQNDSEQNSWCGCVPGRRLDYRLGLCCTTTTVAVTSTCRFLAMTAKEAKSTYVPC
jgi:hypothetical protein